MCPTENQLANFLKSWVGDSKPFVLSPHLSLTTPLWLTLLYIHLGKGVFNHLIVTVSSAILVQASPVDLSSITSKSGGLAQVITQCMVPSTTSLTFDDVQALSLAYPIYIY